MTTNIDLRDEPPATVRAKGLRDEYAMAALHIFSGGLHLAADRMGAIKNAAKSAYALADAMMEARK